MNSKLGLVFTVTGALLLILSLFDITKKENVVNIGPFHVSAEKKQPTEWMRYTGGIIFAGGIILLVTAKKR